MATPGPTAPAGATAPPSPPSAGRPTGTSRGVLVVVVAVVVVVAALLGAVASGWLSFSTSGTGTGASTSYASAESIASSTAAQVYPGPWSLYAVIGADDRQAYTNSSLGASSGCKVTGGTDVLSLPATSGNYSDGDLSAWIFAYVSTTNDAQLAIEVTGSHATELGVARGASCGSPSALLPVPTGALDSTQVAKILLGDSEVEAFLHDYTSANASYTLLNPRGGNVGASWGVEYTVCGLNVLGVPQSPSGTRGGIVQATVNATTGVISSVAYQASFPCAGSGSQPTEIPLGTAFAAGNPVGSLCPTGDTYALEGCTAGDYTYTLTVEASTLNLSSVLFEVTTSNGGVYSISTEGGFSIVNVIGLVVAQSSPSTELEMLAPWSTYNPPASSGTPLTSLDTIEIDMGTANPAGDNLYFIAAGTGNYSGTTAPLALP
ncbi:MAG TPA: hypothetical protein VMI55_04375 [Thermoplasmata archaeon]|nr:hypothetical protein [Thermoplasmata archaeon]